MKTKFLITAITMVLFGISTASAQDHKDHTGHDHAKMEKAEEAYACSMKCEGDKTYSKPGECPKCGMTLTKVEAKAPAKEYYCTMKCEGDKTYAEKGDCPKCGMKLVEKKADSKKKAKKHDDHSGHKH